MESLAARRSDLDRQAEALGKELTRKLAQAVTQRLDLAAPGRLAEARAFLIEVERHLARLRSETEQAADAHWRELEALDTELERVEEEMDGLTARFPELNWRAILAILSSPRRLLGLFLAYRDLAWAGATYGTLLARQMAVATEVLRRDLVVEAYEEALKGVQDQRAQVASLEGEVGELKEEVEREGGVRRKLRELSRRGRLVVDGHVPEAVPPEETEVAIVLRLDPRELRFRLEARGYPPEKIRGNVESEILDVCLVEAINHLGEGKVFEIDTTGKTVEEVVREAERVVLERKGPRPGSVDWTHLAGLV